MADSTTTEMSEQALFRLTSSYLRELPLAMLTRPKQLRQLHSIISTKSRQYRDVAEIITLLPRRRPIHVLLDFDVIYSYITSEDAGNAEELQIRHFFEYSTITYSIPPGALEELRIFLSQYAPFVHRLESCKDEDCVEAIDSLISELAIDKTAGNWLSEEHATLKRSQQSEKKKVVMARLLLDRLLRVLTQRRFTGITTEYDTTTYGVLCDALTEYDPRTRLVSRNAAAVRRVADRNRRDAQNLAAACLLNKRSSDSHFMILTKRKDVKIVADRYVDAVQSVADYMFVAHSDEMLWLSITGYTRYGHAVLASVTDAVDRLQGFANSIQTQLIAVDSGIATSKRRVANVPVKLRKAVDLCVEALKGVSQLSIMRLEACRSPFISSDAAKTHHHFDHSVSGEPTEPLTFLQTLNAIRVVINEGLGQRYKRVGSTEGGLQQFAILDVDQVYATSLCSIVPSINELSHDWRIEFTAESDYATFCASIPILTCASSDLTRAQTKAKRSSIVPIINPDDEIIAGACGMLVTYSYGQLWFPFSQDVRVVPEDLSSLHRLAQHATQFLTRGARVRVGAKQRPIVPQVIHVWLVLKDVEIEFDVYPGDRSMDRQAIVVGNGPYTESITRFIESVGPTLINHERMAELCEGIIK